VVAGGMPGYGTPHPGGYGVPPAGYGPAAGMQPPPGYPMQPQAAYAPAAPGAQAPQPGYAPAGLGAQAPLPPAQPPVNPQFMYGPQGQPPPYGLTGEMAAQQAAPPPNPYAQPAVAVTRALLQGTGGVFTVPAGTEMRIGRDGALCQILLTEPRVSGVHAAAKLENGQLMIRDEKSNNGTVVNGVRLAPGVWTLAPNGSVVRFGPAEFNVRLE
jgi:hypothetical protein